MLRISVWLIVAAAYLLLASVAFSEQRLVAAVFVFVVCTLAITTAPANLGLLSWTAGIPVFYAVLFAVVPLITGLWGVEDESIDREVTAALHLVAVGILAFTVGTRVMQIVLPPRASYDLFGLLKIDLAERPAFILLLAVIGATALLWSYFFGYFGLVRTEDQTATGAGVLSSIAFLLTVATAMAWNAYFRQQKQLLLALMCTVLMLGAGALSSSKEWMLLPFVLMALSHWGTSGKFPWTLSIATLLLYVFVVFPFVTASRVVLRVGASRSELASLTIEYWFLKDWAVDTVGLSAVESLGRGILPYLAQIVQHTGTSVAYMSGRTIGYGLETFVPRFLASDKPDMDIGNWTAQAYDAISWFDQTTNVSPTYVGEFYMNFGLVGVAIGMFSVGLLAVFVDRYLIVSRHAWTMPIFVYFVRWQESFIGHTILPFIKSAMLWAVILIAINYIARPSSPKRAQAAAG